MANTLQPIPMWSLPRYKTPGMTPPIAPQQRFQGPAWLQKIAGGFDKFMGVGQQQNPYLSPEENAAAQNQQRMAMVASLLQNSGPRPQGTQGLLQPFGDAMQAGQAAQQGAVDNALKMRMLAAQIQNANNSRLIGVANPSDFTPESLGKYQQSGNPQDLVRVEANTLNRVNPRDYTPESLAKYEQTGNLGDLVRIAPYQRGTGPSGNVQRFDPIAGTVEDITSPDSAVADAANLARAKSEATSVGEAEGKAWGAIMAKATSSEGIEDILDLADPLIDVATGSGGGAARDKVGAFFGYSSTGDQAIGQLRVLQAALMLNQPRMEGPQSDKDVVLYQQAAAELGDPSVPRERKKAAASTIRQLQVKYRNRASGGAPESAALPDFSSMSDDELRRLANGQ